MKLRSLVLLAALGFGLTACNNDGDDLLKDEESKSVTISLANVLPQSKGTGTQIPDADKKVALNDYYVVFTDGTNLYGGYDLDPTTGEKVEASKYYSAATTLSKTFHFVNGAANQAIVIGNVGGETGGLKTQLDGCNTLAALNDLVCRVADEQDEKDLTLYGTGDFVEKGNVDDKGHTNVYTAAINVKPLIARIEVTGFKYAKVNPETATKYSKITLNKIAIDNYYTAVQLDGTYSGEPSFYNVPATGNSENFFGSLNPGWTNDDFTSVYLEPDTEKKVSEILTAETKDAYVYHVAAGATIPHILLKMQGVQDADNVPLHIVAKGLKSASGAAVSKLDAGKVYRLSFEFNDDDLEQPTKCVEVSVTVADWVVEVVTPVF